MRQSLLVLGFFFAACGASSNRARPDAGTPGDGGASDASALDFATPIPDALSTADGLGDSALPLDQGLLDGGPDLGGSYGGTPGNLRIASANLTSGTAQSYDPGAGLHILEGLRPDVVLIQEFNYGANTDTDVRKMIDKTFGPTFSYFRESGAQIPNGVVSRWPIIASGSWVDPQVSNRGFAYAEIALPGAHHLWAVSLHLLTSTATDRAKEATSVVAHVKATVPSGDYLVIGGDFNTGVRNEACVTTLAQVVATAAPYPNDGSNSNTSGTRSKPHDWVLPGSGLERSQVATTIGANTFPAGLVFDSRVYKPLSDVPPVVAGDSGAPNMQHMAVVKDFYLLLPLPSPSPSPSPTPPPL